TLCEETSARPPLYLIDESSFERSLVRRQCTRAGISRQGLIERFVARQLPGEGASPLATVTRLGLARAGQRRSRSVCATLSTPPWQKKEITRTQHLIEE